MINEIGKSINLTLMQQEAYMMAVLHNAKIQAGSPLDRIHSDAVFHGRVITPTFFSILVTMLQHIQGRHLLQIVKQYFLQNI